MNRFTILFIMWFAVFPTLKAEESSNKYSKTAEVISAKYKQDPIQTTLIINTAVDVSEQKGIDPILTLAIIATESEFNPKAYNKTTGASGLTQVLKGLHAKLIASYNGSIFDPYIAIQVGTDLLKTYSQWNGGNTKKALNSYGGDSSGYYYKKVMENYRWIDKTVERDI